ncbi:MULTISPECIES: ABC transporter permease [unclassified Butyrivibrio]|uniref:ABC transporter permease n=1 Tax=unclassified Butyrivibrio TaxID=2639466 RepID=UPI0004293211|nr:MULTISPECIES: ABC transporter permease [unclassified Butyrivibrio]
MKRFLALFKKNTATGRRNTYLILGMAITGVVLLMVIIGIFYTPYSPTKMDSSAKLQGMSLKHLMGTDNMGRDVFSRVLYGSRITLAIATFTILLGAGVGTVIGALTGYFGGIADEITMRIVDAMLAFPSILLSLVFVSLFGTGTYQVAVALGISFVPSFARIVRSEFLRCKNMDYVEVAKLQGVSSLRIIFVHILPNTVEVLLSSVMIGFNNAVLAEAGLSFLGIGAQPPYASLGNMLSDAQGYLFNKPSYVISIGVVIVLMVLGFSFLGEGIKRISS